ncbi:hypothetical protein DPMN_171710 [Dreissena polymorpha]|uniref:Uncharacterized protein n=1 Tax=Dreissena polymorpha TaxID=45954 RepID=A0A9D4DZM6_DREPO|nr:hypothetical protein DPMN_171710 [Dreissena polymorpha]
MSNPWFTPTNPQDTSQQASHHTIFSLDDTRDWLDAFLGVKDSTAPSSSKDNYAAS